MFWISPVPCPNLFGVLDHREIVEFCYTVWNSLVPQWASEAFQHFLNHSSLLGQVFGVHTHFYEGICQIILCFFCWNFGPDVIQVLVRFSSIFRVVCTGFNVNLLIILYMANTWLWPSHPHVFFFFSSKNCCQKVESMIVCDVIVSCSFCNFTAWKLEKLDASQDRNEICKHLFCQY